MSRHTFFTKLMTEEFMRKHVEDLEWWSLLHSIKPSESFIREMSDYIDINWIAHNKRYISKNFLREWTKEIAVPFPDGRRYSFEDWLTEHVIEQKTNDDIICDF